ncbi:MAG TPA: caspase family protein [Polyangia bacterium]|jgi:Caspase domain.|nr:caspase family protein [Polyangia bacterium]
MTSRFGIWHRPGLLGLCTLASFALAGPAQAETRRFAVVIGANIGDVQEARLRFAEADADKVAHTLRSVGEFPAAQVVQMNGVTADEVRRALIELNARLRQEASDTVLLVYYSGHADADNLHMGGTHLGARELRDILAGSSANSRVLVIDACRSGAVTRVKGGSPTAPFTVHLGEIPPPAGLAILTSSAEGEDSQESDALAGSFFTHYFNSGLIGAADQNHDGQVTLAEAFSFASEQTYRATVATVAGPQHPTFRFDLGGRQDLVLARPRTPRQGLGILQFNQAGRYVVHRLEASGLNPVVAEVAARTGGAQVALPAGRYEIILRNPEYVLEGTAEVSDGAVASVTATDLRRADYARLVRKGGDRARVYSLMASGGVHTAPYGLGWFGPAAGLSLRRDSRRFSLEARVLWEHSSRDSDSMTPNIGIDMRTEALTATAAGLRSLDLGPVTLSAGVEAGALLLLQKPSSEYVDPRSVYPVDNPPPALRMPGQLSSTTSLGPVVGPLFQMDFRLFRNWYARFDAGLPLCWMQVKDNRGVSQMEFGWRGRVMVGAGAYF